MSEWISVDTSPKEYDAYLGWFEGKTEIDGSFAGIAVFTKSWGWCKPSGNRASDIFCTLTHWMPLPDGPK